MSSGGRALKADEVEASRLFPLLTGRQCEELDGTSVASGQPDFKLLDSAGIQVGTLEVTQHTDQQAMATTGAANKVDWSLPAGLGTWRLDVEIGAQMSTIMRTVIPTVQQAAAADEVTVTPSDSNATAMAPNKILRVMCLDPSGPDEVWPMVSPDGGATSRDVLADVAEQEVAANLSKLGPVSGLERHLLVWLDWYGPMGADAMAYSYAEGHPGKTPRPPVLAADCTVWLAISGERWAVRWRSANGWDVARDLTPSCTPTRTYPAST